MRVSLISFREHIVPLTVPPYGSVLREEPAKNPVDFEVIGLKCFYMVTKVRQYWSTNYIKERKQFFRRDTLYLFICSARPKFNRIHSFTETVWFSR